ncbi:YybH family protein [Tepidiforma thermophila]|uniref:Ketosteroid isomerase-like protein n=1 Tax=Tepidiforma thermophila (strain KCTC 52669 / CGMCC 1.13589 / G233) TaxID=2761530 RepID=A0A2A9HJ98_TEPT2|nr:nuclear transport factor 2 family protein [Tepidiforma thermophila]PFG74929.1 ketosteroid isomerase-like protein [Tepidiforma thermophila]
MDIERFNAEWLLAWTEKDVPRLLAFYHPEVEYRDGQVPQGVKGHAALRAYLEGLFAATPPMTYVPDEVWPIAGGYCGRWYCTVTLPDGSARRLRGFDLVLLDGDRISFNEVYTHNLP